MTVTQTSGTEPIDGSECIDTDGEPERLILQYRGDGGSTHVKRTWNLLGKGADDAERVVREHDKEEMFNYAEDRWETVSWISRDHEVSPTGRLVGDGSNWDGEGRLWYEWAIERHVKRLNLRFPHENITLDDVELVVIE